MACTKPPVNDCPPPHHHCDDQFCGCINVATSAAESATSSALAAAESALLAQRLLQNCLTDKTIKPGGGLKYEEDASGDPLKSGIVVDTAALAGAGLSGAGGKLKADLAYLASNLAGDGLTASGGKLKADVSNLATSLAGKGLSVSGGKLTVNFQGMDNGDRGSLIGAIIQTGGGLAVDPTTGKIYFDPEGMDTTVFKKLLKTLRLPQYLDKAQTFYVDKSHANADDGLVEGRGLSRSLPFKKIQPCIDFVCQNYNFGVSNVTIEINDGAYEEFLTLPDYATTTGALIIQPRNMNASRPVVVKNPAGQYGQMLHVTGPKDYYIRHLAFEQNINAAAVTSAIYPSMVAVESGATARLSGLSLKLGMSGAAVGSGGQINAQMLTSTGIARIGVDEQLPFEFIMPAAMPTGAMILMLNASSGGQILLVRSRTEVATQKIYCQGAATRVAQTEYKGMILHTGSGSNIFSFEVPSGQSVSGKRYHCVSGGSISTDDQGANYFPGSSNGTVEAETYSWYK